MYKRIQKFQNDYPKEAKELNRQRLQTWRRQNAITKIDRPTDLYSARRLGYKPKQGIILVRARVPRGGRRLSPPTKGRRSKRSGVKRITPNLSRQTMAENRAARAYRNLEVLNSYKAGKDGRHIWFEIILIDPFHPVIQSDKHLNWISPDPAKEGEKRNPARHKGRSFRGLTSSGRKSRGLRHKGKGAEHVRN
jgi:large subunit ribosomal protein L15e